MSVDPAAVVAEHEGSHWCSSYPHQLEEVWVPPDSEPCLPYRLAEALAAALERIELLTEPPEPLDPVEQDALDDRDWDYAMRMLSKARAANHGYYRINEDLRDRLLDAEDALAAEQAKTARVAELAHRFELIPRARLLGALTAKAKS